MAAPAAAAAAASSSSSSSAKIEGAGSWDVYRDLWKPPSTTTTSSSSISHSIPTSNHPFSFFSPHTLTRLSHSPKISSVIALGTVLAITLRDMAGSGSGSGYSSNAAVELQKILLLPRETATGEVGGIHCRILGDVLYVMTSLTTKREVVEGLEGRLVEVLC